MISLCLDYLLWSLNLIIFLIVIFVNRQKSLTILNLGYYLIFITSWFASHYMLHNYDWWLRNVSASSIRKAFYLVQFYLLYYSIFVIYFSKNRHKDEFVWNCSYALGFEIKFFKVVVVLSAVILIVFSFKNSALYDLIFHANVSKDQLARLRIEGSAEYKGSVLLLYFNNLITKYLLYSIYVFFAILYVKFGLFKKWFFFTAAVVGICSLIDLSKFPIVSIVILYMLIKIYYDTTIRFKNILKYTFAILSIFVILYVVVMGSHFIDSFSKIGHRIFLSQYDGFPASFDYYPKHHKFLGLTSISNKISEILGIDFNSHTRLVMEFLNPSGVKKGTAGYMSSLFLAEGYAMYGINSMVIVGMILPILLVVSDSFFLRTKSLLLKSFYFLLLIKVPFLMVNSFWLIILNYGLILTFLIFSILSLLNRYKRNLYFV